MTRLDVDVAIAGSGFSGSLLAAVLQRHGRRVALLDRARHPRFAIGESSTPAANLILRDLAERYGLDWLKPLSRYGTWKQRYPQLGNGIKRGFAWFQHEPGDGFVPAPDHRNELLVAASSHDDVSDTQWLRSDVDAFLFEQACREGVVAVEQAEVDSLMALTPGWLIAARTPDGPVSVRCRFLVDGTGAGGLLRHHLRIADRSDRLRTNSRAVFGHVAGLPRWSDLLSGKDPAATRDHPFDCDHAALHHLLPGGWMWWLRFDSGITSVGLVVDEGTDGGADAAWLGAPVNAAVSAQIGGNGFAGPVASFAGEAGSGVGPAFAAAVEPFPDLRAAFAETILVAPAGGVVRTGRLQRLAAQIVGADWALLPHTAGFIDPLHSTGIAHSLAGVERLARILLSRPDGHGLAEELSGYAATVQSELLLIDRLVSGCCTAMRQRSFRKFAAWSMCYFAAATTWERQRLSCPDRSAALFLADDRAFCQAVAQLQPRLETETESAFEHLCEETIAPFNHAGLFRPAVPGMYARTAVPDNMADNAADAGRAGRATDSGDFEDEPRSQV